MKLVLKKNKHGFTIVELLIVLTIIALLLSIVTPKYFDHIQEAKEMVLKQNLSTIRYSLDKFYSDRGRYPESLQELIYAKYLREIPSDPTNEKQEWQIIKDDTGQGIYDVKSTNYEIGSNKKRYSEW